MRAAIVVLLCPFITTGQAPKPKLLPTEPAARKIRAIQDKLLLGSDPGESLTASYARHERLFKQLNGIVSDFVVSQLDADPEIGQWPLRDQLVRLFGGEYD